MRLIWRKRLPPTCSVCNDSGFVSLGTSVEMGDGRRITSGFGCPFGCPPYGEDSPPHDQGAP